MMDKELKAYRKLIGVKEYEMQYHRLYSEAKQHKERYSGLEYTNSPERLQKIKEKYKDGVSLEILNSMFSGLKMPIILPKK